MGRQSHPVVTKLRGGIVSFARNCSTWPFERIGEGQAVENKDHSALIAPLRSNRGTGWRWIPPFDAALSLVSSLRVRRVPNFFLFSLFLLSLFPLSSGCSPFSLPLLSFRFSIYFVSPCRAPRNEERRHGAEAGTSINDDKLRKLHQRATDAWMESVAVPASPTPPATPRRPRHPRRRPPRAGSRVEEK